MRSIELTLSPAHQLSLALPKDWRDIPYARDDPPLWAAAWPSGTATALHLLEHPELIAGKRVCDVGCGVGTAGIAAGLAGAREVILADRSPLALECAMAGAVANGVGSRCEARTVDWHCASSERTLAGPFDVILACDVFYSLDGRFATADEMGSLRDMLTRAALGDDLQFHTGGWLMPLTVTSRALAPSGLLLAASPVIAESESPTRSEIRVTEIRRCPSSRSTGPMPPGWKRRRA